MINRSRYRLDPELSVLSLPKPLGIAIGIDGLVVADNADFPGIPFGGGANVIVGPVEVEIREYQPIHPIIALPFFHGLKQGRMVPFMDHFIPLYVKTPV